MFTDRGVLPEELKGAAVAAAYVKEGVRGR